MIGGLEPCSFIDFPGCLSAVVFFRGCNLRCPYCHNASLLNHDGVIIADDELLDFLSSRRGQLDGVVFSGGEPTLQSGLRALIEAARALDYKIKLDTNGTRPEVLSNLLSAGLIDYIAMDLKDEPEAYGKWLGMREAYEKLLFSLDIVKTSGIDHELRTTIVPVYHDKDRLSRMAHWAAGSRRWILQPCKPDLSRQLSANNPIKNESLEKTAAQLREEHGVNCYTRSEATHFREINIYQNIHIGEVACP